MRFPRITKRQNQKNIVNLSILIVILLCALFLPNYFFSNKIRTFSRSLSNYTHFVSINGSYPECTFCSFSSLIESNSTINDGILISSISSHKSKVLPPSILPLIASFRAAGCKAKIFVFISSDIIITTKQKRILSKCGVEFIDVGFPSQIEWKYPKLAQYVFVAEYIKFLNLERIFFTDGTDGFAFGDPFSAIPYTDQLIISTIPEKLQNCKWCLNQFQKCYNNLAFLSLKNRTYYSTSVLAGTTKVFTEFISGMIHKTEFMKCPGRALEQIHLNQYIFSDVFSYPIIPFNCESYFISLSECQVWNTDFRFSKFEDEKYESIQFLSSNEKLIRRNDQINGILDKEVMINSKKQKGQQKVNPADIYRNRNKNQTLFVGKISSKISLLEEILQFCPNLDILKELGRSYSKGLF